jgi:hypothetical protein
MIIEPSAYTGELGDRDWRIAQKPPIALLRLVLLQTPHGILLVAWHAGRAVLVLAVGPIVLFHFQIKNNFVGFACRATALSAARLRVLFDLEMELPIG